MDSDLEPMDELGWAQKSCPTERLCAIGSKVSFGFEIFVPLFKLLAIIVSTVVMFCRKFLNFQ